MRDPKFSVLLSGLAVAYFAASIFNGPGSPDPALAYLQWGLLAFAVIVFLVTVYRWLGRRP